MEAARGSDKPAVLVYRRTERVPLYPDDPEFAEKHLQWQTVEAFFEVPQAVRRRHPEIYHVLSTYFGQDPAAWDDARGLRER